MLVVINNPIYKILSIFGSYKKFIDSLDWNYLRRYEIVKSRFEEACEEAGMRVPESIIGYKYI